MYTLYTMNTKQKPKIVVSEELKKKLDSLGKYKETYEDIIWRLIKYFKEVKKNDKKGI